MYTTTLLSLLAGSALAAPTGHLSRRQEDCSYYPNQKDQASGTYILRVEPVSASNITMPTNSTTNSTLPHPNNTNTTALGYLDALSTSHALLAPSRAYASEAFNAPNWNTNQKLLFWPGNAQQPYERGFNLDPAALSSPAALAPVVSTPGCGTPLVDFAPGDDDDDGGVGGGACGLAGRRVRAQTGCPAWGTANGGHDQCTLQKFFACDHTGLQGISDEQQAIFYGVAETAVAGAACREVQLVSECP